jgi:hypothetical protein
MVRFPLDPKGNIETPSQQELKAADAHSAIIAFVNGTMSDGRPYYAYLAVKPSKCQQFYERTAAGEPLILSEYGTVIIAGFASQPPENVVAFMQREFGYSDTFEANLRQQLAVQRAENARREDKAEGDGNQDPAKPAH